MIMSNFRFRNPRHTTYLSPTSFIAIQHTITTTSTNKWFRRATLIGLVEELYLSKINISPAFFDNDFALTSNLSLSLSVDNW